MLLQAGADVAVCAYDRVEEDGRVLCTENLWGFHDDTSAEDDTLAFYQRGLVE